MAPSPEVKAKTTKENVGSAPGPVSALEPAQTKGPVTEGGATLAQVMEAATTGKTGPVMKDRFSLTPSQHLFSQLVVALAGAHVQQQGIQRLSKSTAIDIVRAAKNLAEAIEAVQ